jgi:hypothetical protein
VKKKRDRSGKRGGRKKKIKEENKKGLGTMERQMRRVTDVKIALSPLSQRCISN